MLKKLIDVVRNKIDWRDDENIMVYYMFYNPDNPKLTRTLQYKLIYEYSDFC